jgi:predicted transcriptional regulator
MTENTLKITFKQHDEHQNAARERLRRAEAGESGEAIEQDVRFVLNFEEFDDVDRLMRTSNLKLVEAIVSQRPESIRQAAAAVDRDYREVHRNLKELESLGVIEFETNGQSKKPILREGAENIDFSIRFPRPAENGENSSSLIA